MMKSELLCQKLIKANYSFVDAKEIQLLKTHQQLTRLSKSSRFQLENNYYRAGYPGTLPEIYTREVVRQRLEQVAAILAPSFGLWIFDIFRSKKTQRFLYETMRAEIKQKKPELDGAELEKETRKYVSHPDDPARHWPAPHNTGGAVDLALFDLKTGEKLYFGGPFDLTDVISQTDYFEQDYDWRSATFTENQWMEARRNRRLLFHVMLEVGFTNYHAEWWHYDLGDSMWANLRNTTPLFGSLEQEISAQCAVEF